MKKTLGFALFWLGFIASASAAVTPVPRPEIPGRLSTKLTQTELAREERDRSTYPNFMKFLRTVDATKLLHPTDPRNAHLIKSANYMVPDQKLWDAFLAAAVADHLTVLRAFALMAREIKKFGVVVLAPGTLYERAIAENRVDLGLALPAKNVSAALWMPDPSVEDPEFQLHMKVFYTESYVHELPDDLMPANLKIGYGDEATYWMDGEERKQRTIDADIYYGDQGGVGFRNVKGIGGQKRGVAGFFQKLLFFLPDAVHSMVIDEKSGVMVTEALINTRIEEFERNPKYSMKITQ
jgi:hypothetical protein